ncbi:hypothetical protein EDC01DRAFT_630025 [Geopyxis carbonaria]|nr:hypothetical protein EDC01DRAFT_630025 [Geopyxis carbonaria]
MSKTVAVIGGGPSGLATAKYLIEFGLQPTIFEARSHVGGLWAPREDGIETLQLDPEMKVNATKYTCTFSDFFPSAGADLPMFPTAAEIGQYLQRYADRFLPKERIRLCTLVTNVSRSGLKDNLWKVTFSRRDCHSETTENFTYLVIATGVWSGPYIPAIPNLANFNGNVFHSSQYVGKELFTTHSQRKIVVVGGTLSGVEIATDIALRACSLPETERGQIKIIHVFPKPPWILPKMIGFNNPEDILAPRVLPLDLFLYNVEGRTKIDTAQGPEDIFTITNTMMPVFLGDQGDIHPALKVDEYWSKGKPAVGISDSYTHFVRSGVIEPKIGRLSEVLDDNKTLRFSPVGENVNSWDMTDVDTIYLATGYSPWKSLGRLFNKELLQEFGKPDGVENSKPDVLISRLYKQTLHRAFNNSGGFVGMRTRAFYATIEMQARWLAGLMAGKYQWPTEEDFTDVLKGTSWLIKCGKVREGILQGTGGGDYLDYLTQIGTTMGTDLFRLTKATPLPLKNFIPAYIPSINGDIGEDAKETLIAFEKELEESTAPKNVSIFVFTSLQGRWKISRKLDSRLAGFPSGIFTGWAEFRPRLPTFQSKDSQAQPSLEPKTYSLGGAVTEYLYVEEGELLTESGLRLKGKRKYIYQLEEETGKITVWFVKINGETVDYFFHALDFTKMPDQLGTPGVDGHGGWKASASHLCEKDMYLPAYRFIFKGPKMENFWIRYKVDGPNKDYVSEAHYSRE